MSEENFQEKDFRRTVRNKTLKSFTWFFIFICLSLAAWNWLNRQPKDAGALKPLRTAMSANEKIFSGVFSDSHLEPEYPKTSAVPRVKVNGNYGVQSALDTSAWKLLVVRNSDIVPVADTLVITMDEIKKLPKTEVVFNFKCIEGWSQITWWGGVKFSDFAEHFHLGTRSGSDPDKNKKEDMFKYAGLRTPDGEYYVGVDMPAMMHPQTILCYEMNGKPLPMNQGAPLRLIIPVKYGVKHLKRIGTLFFSDTPPPDFWYERGYDYYAGL
jgi:DMSO/TMAO reductase YedYZ molybdopterin-dependent catalytic subunit